MIGKSNGGEEDVALSCVSKVVQRIVDKGPEGVPGVLVGCLQELSKDRTKGTLSVEKVLSEFVLLKGLKDGGLLGKNPGEMMERCLVVFVRVAVGWTAGTGTGMENSSGPLTIYMQAKTASVQVRVSRWLTELMNISVSEQGTGVGGALHFESSFSCGLKPKEMLKIVTMRCEELHLLHSAVEEGVRGGRGGNVAGVLASLVKPDIGLTSSEDRDSGIVILTGKEEKGKGGDSGVALQEGAW